MKSLYLNKIISSFLILLLVSHIFVLHSKLENLVVCYGNDGHIEIENTNDCDDCSDPLSFTSKNVKENITIKSVNCLDLALDFNCFEDNNFISKQSSSFINNYYYIISFLIKPEIFNKENDYYSFIPKDNIHESVKTISLLI